MGDTFNQSNRVSSSQYWSQQAYNNPYAVNQPGYTQQYDPRDVRHAAQYQNYPYRSQYPNSAQYPQYAQYPTAANGYASYGWGGVPPTGTPQGPGGVPQNPEDPDDAKKDNKPKGVWRVMFVLSIVVFVVALVTVGYIVYTYWNGQNEYDKLTEYLQVDDNEGDPTLASFNVDWDGLRAINSDVVGWIYVPETVINYPIVWRENDDAYYMTHNFGMNSVGGFGAEYGCIALSSINSPDWTDQANFISGHHMRNGSMFALLGRFTDSGEFNAHRTFYILTPQGNFKCTSFACDKVPGSSNAIIVPSFESQADFHEYLQKRVDESLVTPDPPGPDVEDIEQIIMLYTCSEPDNSYRICVYTSVDEFVPAGSDKSQANALVENKSLSDVEDAVGERLL